MCCVDLYEQPRNKTNAVTGRADDFNNRIEGERTAEEIQRLYGRDGAMLVRADMTQAADVENAVAKCEKNNQINEPNKQSVSTN